MINIIVRPMYITDNDFRKGMTVAVYEGTTDGSWIARNADNISNSKALKDLEKKNPGQVNIRYLFGDEIKKELTGWTDSPEWRKYQTKLEDIAIQEIKNRIKAEYDKYKDSSIDWMEMLARKIHASFK